MGIKPEEKKSIFISLRVKLMIGFTLLFSLVFAAAFYWFYTFAEQVAISRIQEDMVSTLQGAIKQIDGDELVALAREGKPDASGFKSDDPRYKKMLQWLETVHELEPRAWTYLYVPGNETNEIIYVVDLQVDYDLDRASKFQLHYVSNKGFITGGLKELTLHTTDGVFADYPDEYGEWVSAYAPVYDLNGKPVAGMGVDFQADYVQSVRQSVINNIVVAFIITYGILFLLVFLVSGAFTKPIQRLTKAAERIGEGDYQQNLKDIQSGRSCDEITKLAYVFEIMVDKVYQREQSLRHQVEELKIEIDEAKRHSQVREIVDSDFFRDLQEKAKVLKGRTNPI